MGFSRFALHDAEVMFEALDRDGSGAVDYTEMGEMLGALDIKLSKRALVKLVDVLDKVAQATTTKSLKERESQSLRYDKSRLPTDYL